MTKYTLESLYDTVISKKKYWYYFLEII